MTTNTVLFPGLPYYDRKIPEEVKKDYLRYVSLDHVGSGDYLEKAVKVARKNRANKSRGFSGTVHVTMHDQNGDETPICASNGRLPTDVMECVKSAACHAFFSSALLISESKKGTYRHCVAMTTHRSDKLSEENAEKLIPYFDWLLNRSPVASVFLVKDPVFAAQVGVVTHFNAPYNMLLAGLQYYRLTWDVYGGRWSTVWPELNSLGVEENINFMLASVFYRTATDATFRYSMGGEGGHTPFGRGNSSQSDAIKNLINGVIPEKSLEGRGPSYSDRRTGVTELYSVGRTSKSPEEFFRRVFTTIGEFYKNGGLVKTGSRGLSDSDKSFIYATFGPLVTGLVNIVEEKKKAKETDTVVVEFKTLSDEKRRELGEIVNKMFREEYC